VAPEDAEYAPAIRRFFQEAFPCKIQHNTDDKLDLITGALIGTGKVRYGPKPSIESQYEIRRVVTRAIANDHPIKILVPWGSEKPAHRQIVDVAEVCGLKTISAINERVKQFHEPGISVRIRIEDASAPHLFHDDPAQAWFDAQMYTNSFVGLIHVLGLGGFIEHRPESRYIEPDEFSDQADKYVEILKDYLLATNAGAKEDAATIAITWDALLVAGWKGPIPQEQRQHYYDVYRKLYGDSDQAATERLARYFAGSLARYKLKIVGNEGWEDDHLSVSFQAPIPGEPKNRVSTRLYYRTVPESISTTHIVPWRAKGYLSIQGDGSIRPRLTSWSDNRNYHRCATKMSGHGIGDAWVQTDYEVVE